MTAMTVCIASERLSARIVEEIHAACREVGARTVASSFDSVLHGPPASAIIAGLPPGQRRVPDEVAVLAASHANARVILCASEPMVRPATTLAEGRLVLLSPPIARGRLVSALRTIGRSTMDVEGSDPSLSGSIISPASTFEALRRSWWVATARGLQNSPRVDVHQNDHAGLTVVMHLVDDDDADPAGVADLMRQTMSDGRREAALWEQLGVDAAVLHISATAAEWCFYWPDHAHRLQLHSAQRLPASTNLSDGLHAAGRRFLRMPAYPGDLMLATVTSEPSAQTAAPEWMPTLAEGGPDVFAALQAATRARSGISGALVEVR